MKAKVLREVEINTFDMDLTTFGGQEYVKEIEDDLFDIKKELVSQYMEGHRDLPLIAEINSTQINGKHPIVSSFDYYEEGFLKDNTGYVVYDILIDENETDEYSDELQLFVIFKTTQGIALLGYLKEDVREEIIKKNNQMVMTKAKITINQALGRT